MFEELVGKEVLYVSQSGREYKALITKIPPRPNHGDFPLPTVSLEFRDERNKLNRKERVLPEGIGNSKIQIGFKMNYQEFQGQGDDEVTKSYHILNFWKSIKSCKKFAALMEEKYGEKYGPGFGNDRLAIMKKRVCKNHNMKMPEVWKNEE